MKVVAVFILILPGLCLCINKKNESLIIHNTIVFYCWGTYVQSELVVGLLVIAFFFFFF